MRRLVVLFTTFGLCFMLSAPAATPAFAEEQPTVTQDAPKEGMPAAVSKPGNPFSALIGNWNGVSSVISLPFRMEIQEVLDDGTLRGKLFVLGQEGTPSLKTWKATRKGTRISLEWLGERSFYVGEVYEDQISGDLHRTGRIEKLLFTREK